MSVAICHSASLSFETERVATCKTSVMQCVMRSTIIQTVCTSTHVCAQMSAIFFVRTVLSVKKETISWAVPKTMECGNMCASLSFETERV